MQRINYPLLIGAIAAISTHHLCAMTHQFYTKTNCPVTIEQITSPDLRAEELVFREAFAESYSKLPDIMENILKKYRTLDEFLTVEFEDEVSDYRNKKPGTYFLHAVVDGNVVAYLLFYCKETEAFARMLVVAPAYRHLGLVRGFGDMILKLCPKINRVTTITRRANKPAIDVYKHFGFVETDYTHPGLDPKDYIGMTLIIK